MNGQQIFKFTSLFCLLFGFTVAAHAVVDIDAIPAGTWVEIPNSNLSSVAASPTPPGNTGTQSVMNTWNGGVYDTERDRLVVWGGGHADYAGNEIYAFDLASQSWSMIQAPTPNNQIITSGSVEIYADGNPSSRHTYDGLVYLPPPYDALWSQGGSRWVAGGGTSATWQYQFSNSSWIRKAKLPTSSKLGVVSAFDPVSGHVIHRGKFAVSSYNPADNTYKQLFYNSGGWWWDRETAAIDPTRRYFVVIGNRGTGAGGGTWVFDLKTNTFFTPPVSGDISITNALAPGLVYDPVSDQMVAWAGGSDIFTLNLDTWVWKKVSANGGAIPTMPPPAGFGTYGRFQYIPSKNVFIGVNSIYKNVYILKLTDSDGSGAGQDKKIVDLQIRELKGEDHTDEHTTFGHVFAKGDLKAGDKLIAELSDGAEIPLQVDTKSTHVDGSLRHAILSLKLPSINSNEIKNILLKKGNPTNLGNNLQLADLVTSGLTSSVTVSLEGKNYIASINSGISDGAVRNWLDGGLAAEWLVRSRLKDDQGNEHPHLVVRFNVRTYAGFSKAKVDVIVENNWAFVDAPQNFTYDVTIDVSGSIVYTKTALKHFRQARWKKSFWHNGDPGLDVIYDKNYLMQSRAFPNYDTTIQIAESTLVSVENHFNSTDSEPMGISVVSPYMPGTGGRSEIGPLPKWSAMYLLSMDKRAKDGSLIVGDSAGSWSIHYRDRNTDLPVVLQDYPYMTLSDNRTSTYNSSTGEYEAFPPCSGDCSTPYSADTSHQPSFAYLPYIITGDHFYLEEMMFWAGYNAMFSGAQYRNYAEGILKWDQIRGQAWSLRTLGQLAYILPDSHELKNYFNTMLENNLDWYNTEYSYNSNANKLGILTQGYAFPYDGGRSASPWMDDFFTWSVGYLKALDFASASPILEWKVISPIERMTNPGYCMIFGAPYRLTVRDTVNDPLYDNFAQVYAATATSTVDSSILSLACGSQEMASAIGLAQGQMWGSSSNGEGYPANMQPALAVATETAHPRGSQAWEIFEGRSGKPNYAAAPQFAVVPFVSKGVIAPSLPTKPVGLSLRLN